MSRWRFVFIVSLISACSVLVLGRLAYLQVVNHSFWSAFAQGQQNIPSNTAVERGQIFFSDSTLPAATNQNSYLVYLTPAEVKDTQKTVDFLSQALGLDKNTIESDLSNKADLFVELKDNLTADELAAIKSENLPGVHIQSSRDRFYPQGVLASNVLGFVDADGNGQYGVEGSYNNLLSGDAELNQSGGIYGFLSLPDQINSPDEGVDLTLTIDHNIQYMAEKLLGSAVKNYNASSGQIIVANPNTGAIIAMADYPDFNPNNYSEYAKNGNLSVFQNAATQELFEPGSALKPITMAIGLQEGKITPQTTYIDKGYVKIGDNVIYNYAHAKYGEQTMTNVLEKSINTGAVFVEQQIPHNVFLDYLSKFGLFEKTGVDIPETYSENKNLKQGYEVNFATASFGQGIEMTPLQLVRAICAIANGGRLPTPYVVAKETQGDQTVETQPKLSAPIISQQTASEVATMMVSVVDNGFGKTGKVSGYYVAGKTGTAQVAENGGYSSTKTIQSFIGFAPAYNPKFVILVKLNNPNTSDSEFSAGPVFSELAKYILNYWQIPPDRPQ